MALTDIQEKKAEERKREKRLVHLTNTLSRGFLDSPAIRSQTSVYKAGADYLARGFLDYIFFEEKKEIREITNTHIQNFMLDYALRRLALGTDTAKELPGVMTALIKFLEAEAHIRNSAQLVKTVDDLAKTYLKSIPKTAKKAEPRRPKKTAAKKTEPKVGRNDPCPCGSGKKYKKCCGQTA